MRGATFAANGADFHAKDDMIVDWIRKTGRAFEPETTEWMCEQLAGLAGLFVDVGASTGWFSVPFAKAGREVVAFEPNPLPAARLRSNAALNGVGIGLIEAAASDCDGQAVLHHNAGLPLTSGASLEAGVRPVANRGRMTVRTVTVDSAIAGRPVALMKVDVEGHEMSVLAGARETIALSRPPLVLEANGPGERATLAAWCEAHAYVWRAADERNMLCSPSS